VKVISSTKIDIINQDSKNKIVETDNEIILNQKVQKTDNTIKLAYICNWSQQCGISTYSKFIYDELKIRVDSSKIFSEQSHGYVNDDEVSYCWKRGEILTNLIQELKDYEPNIILLQHEWGIFPNAGYFMSFITEVKRLGIPIITTIHSVYSHEDKLIPLSVLDNIIVHSKQAKELLEKSRFKGNVFVIPHGCPDISQKQEVYNIFQTPYLLFGYGFGFKYKGVEMAIDAVKFLKENDSKFKNILYIYVCSESENNKGVHENYYNILSNKVKDEGLEDNVLLIKGFLEPEMLDIYLRTVKMVIFPYISDPNGVCGSSGAIKIAMSYNIPVVASQSHLFDDVEGYVIRALDSRDLAKSIDELFSNTHYREQTINKAHQFISNNSWSISVDRYIEVIKIVKSKT
jgi:glycosyltransferase involved in cell wall biosynthesis